MMSRASAPGKLVLLGDYAVLEGSIALVAAVNRRAEGQIDPNGPPSAVVDAVLARAESNQRVSIDTSAFYRGKQKLGIGSSAAVAVVTAALATERGDESCLSAAIEGHRAAAGGVGSGIDVAASFYGGLIATRHQPAEVEVLPSGLRGLYLSVLFAGQSASTAELVRACRAHSDWMRWMSILGPLSEEGILAWQQQNSERFLSVVARYGRAMKSMGEAAEVPIVTPTIAKILACAERLGGAAKPSGAGGGDVVIAFGRNPSFGEQVAEASATILLDLAVDRKGLVRHPIRK